jgi:hypothetical protein
MPEKSLADCSDEEVLSTADATLPTDDDERLSALLHRQQAGLLSGGEPAELLRLMQSYQLGLLRKAQALREAVRRGLRALAGVPSVPDAGTIPRTSLRSPGQE